MRMSFEECLATFHKFESELTFEDLPDHTCGQIQLIGKDRGSFYFIIENGKMTVYSGEYKTRQILYIFTPTMLERILNGVIDPVYAYTTGKFQMLGDLALGRTVLTKFAKAKN